MFVQNLEDLAEELRADFVESEFEGKKGYQHKDTVALSNALKNAKAEKEQYRGKSAELEDRLNRLEEIKKAEYEKRLEEELSKARKDGDTKQLEERLRQQYEDRIKQEREAAILETKKEFAADKAKERKRSLIVELAALGVDDDAREAMRDLLERHVDVDPETGKEFFLDSSGGAMAVDKAGFMAEIRKMPKFRRLVEAATPTKGTGAANGSSGGGATQRKFSEYSGAELAALRKQNPSEYERLRAEHYS